jgi:hypothetical protein
MPADRLTRLWLTDKERQLLGDLVTIKIAGDGYCADPAYTSALVKLRAIFPRPAPRMNDQTEEPPCST